VGVAYPNPHPYPEILPATRTRTLVQILRHTRIRMGKKNMGNTHPAVQTNATKQYNSTTYNKYNNIYIYIYIIP
jgi:hypothetical protein